MAGLIVIGLRLLIWLLLSADLETANVAIGLAVALALPLPRRHRQLPVSALGRSLWASLKAIPLAYREALALLIRRPGREVEELQPVEYRPGSPVAALVFLDVFRITITPLTIALGMDGPGRRYRVHRLESHHPLPQEPGR
ncbi:MAG: Na+/H+ antiporter subunit E [Cyanobacteria bacterium]|jgi:multicomponent Na+:H+ antiporter subunit E|nr:Na+/H+ antiporter subunit E [Cyanobacteriota bacterium]